MSEDYIEIVQGLGKPEVSKSITASVTFVTGVA
jgi:hypothetical protein